MFSTIFSFFMSLFNFFSSLSPETKERIYNIFLDMFEPVLKQMFKNKNNPEA